MVRSDLKVDPRLPLEPQVSVVVVNYNAGKLLSRCVEAALGSSLPVELVLCDNASSDDSVRQVMQRHPQVRLIANDSNIGFAAAANKGLEAARGKWLLLLNPDCILQPDTLERMLAVLEQHPEAGTAGCRIVNPDGSEQRGCRRNLPTLTSGWRKAFGRQTSNAAVDLHTQPLPDGPIHVEAISGAFMLIRRQALEEVGRLDERYFLHCEDLDWCRRFLDAGWKVLFVPSITATHHQGTCSQGEPLRVSWHKHRGMARYYRKHLAANHGVLANLVVIPAIYARFGLQATGLALRWLAGKQGG